MFVSTLFVSLILSPEFVIAQMGADSFRVREWASRQAIYLLEEQLIKLIVASTEHPDLEVRRRCCDAVDRHRGPGGRVLPLSQPVKPCWRPGAVVLLPVLVATDPIQRGLSLCHILSRSVTEGPDDPTIRRLTELLGLPPLLTPKAAP